MPTDAGRTFEIQPWVTIRGNASGPAPWAPVTSITQPESGWIDLERFADAAFWLDVAEVTQPTGGRVQITIESSPTWDEGLFKSATATTDLAPVVDATTGSPLPALLRTVRTPSTVALSRWTRWRVSVSSGSTGPWGVTFRIRGAGGRSSFFSPTQIAGSALWLRSDLGITLGPGTTVSAWADQSGSGNHATAGTTSPTFGAASGVNGLPKVTAGAGAYMTGNFAASVGGFTLFSVVAYPSGTNAAAFAGTLGTLAVNSGFAQFVEIATGVVSRSASGAGFVSASTADTSSVGQVGIYSAAAAPSTTLDLWVNGVSKSSIAISTLAACTKYVLFGLGVPLQYNLVGDAYEHILFNRVLQANERLLVHRYLGARYGIAVP